jgi:single-stranded-DNA-specific exonuclease
MKWEMKSKGKSDDIIETLLTNRGISRQNDIDNFFHPKNPLKLTLNDCEIDKRDAEKAVKRIKKAIKNKESVIVYGDYDADGVCATTVMWETLHTLNPNVMPYIPHRVEEGYGLSKTGIDKIINDFHPSLIITVDHGISGHEKIEYAQKMGIDVIVTDHHVKQKTIPKAFAIVHTTKLCAGGIAWMIAKEISEDSSLVEKLLDIVAVATIADMVPVNGVNRNLVKYGLELLNKTQRPGLNEIIKESGLKKGEIGTYEVGHIIAPRLNATGRLTSAMDSLRLLCTNKQEKAEELAAKLGLTNKDRQDLTLQTTTHALTLVNKETKVICISHETYNQGVIGLVAGKLVEQYYRPAIVISRGEKISKASARSISGFNIIEAIHKMDDLLIDAGGHPMAAGFTIETEKIIEFTKRMENLGKEELTDDKLIRVLKIDCEVNFSDLKLALYERIHEFEPFGFGNPEPVFMSQNVLIKDVRLVGREADHLRLWVEQLDDDKPKFSPQFSAIGFRMGEFAKTIHPGDIISLAYTIALDTWNGTKKLQLKLKDIKTE